MKKLLVSLFVFLLINVYAQTENPEQPPVGESTVNAVNPDAFVGKNYPWHCSDAMYRLEVFLKASKEPSMIDDRRICLPAGGFENGVQVYNSAGLKMPAHQYKDGGVLLPPVDQDSVFFAYFGFTEKQEPESMPDAVDNRRLMLYQSGTSLVTEPQQWRNFEKNNCRNNIANTAKNSKPWEQKCKYGKECTLFKRTAVECPMFIFPFCGRNAAVRGFKAKSACYKKQVFPVLLCCPEFPYAHEFEYVASHVKCVENTTKNVLRNFMQVRTRNLNRIKEVDVTDPEDGLEKSYLAAFGGNPRNSEVGQIFLPKQPFDTGANFIVKFAGNLYVPEDGEYEFMVKANSSRILRIDDKALIRAWGMTPNTKIIGTEESGSIQLTKGIHKFEVLYYKQLVTTWVSASWRRMGEERYETLNEEDFSPANPVQVLGLASQFGLQYPLFQRHDKFALHTDKQEKYFLNVFEPLSGSGNQNLKYHWRLNGRDYPGGINAVALKEDLSDTLTLVPESSGYAPLTIHLTNRITPRIPVRPDLSMKIWASYFLYDDETLDFYTELSSRLPVTIHAALGGAFGKNPDVLSNSNSTAVQIPPLQQEHADRFASDMLLKYPMKVNGTSFLSKPAYFNFSVYIPGLRFDERKLAILPLKNIGGLSCGEDGFYDGDIRVVPLLHRPNLHELRVWELPKRISKEFLPPKKILVIAEDFSTFRDDLEQSFSKDKIKIEFLPWKNRGANAGRDSLESIPEFFDKIRKTDADTAIVIPMTQSRRKTISQRDESRVIAFILQTLRELSGVSTIKLAPPLPSNPDFADAETDEAFVRILRDYKRQYGVDFLELNADFKKMPGFADAYQSAVSGEPDSFFPDGKSREIANLLRSYILNGRK